MSGPLRVIYITSLGHSGSTLLDLLLGGHSQIASVGEVKGFSRGRDQCSCSAPTIWECPFWSAVDRAFRSRLGIPLASIRLESELDDEFVAHNRTLLESIAAVTGRNIIVDSSKAIPRLRRLIETGAVSVLPIHLLRRPEGVVYSTIRRNRGWAVMAYRHGRRNAEVRAMLAGLDSLTIHYEDLTSNPTATLSAILARVGLELEPAQLDWAGRERHNFGGNEMRVGRDSTIRTDTRWREALPAWKIAAIRALGRAGEMTPPRLFTGLVHATRLAAQ